jgi:hypothetical protein
MPLPRGMHELQGPQQQQSHAVPREVEHNNMVRNNMPI